MSGRRVSIAVVMKLTAIIALNLALPRAVPYLWVFQFPPFLFLIVAARPRARSGCRLRPPPSDLLLHVLDRGYRLDRRGHGSLLKGIPPAGVIAAHSGDHDPALPGSPRGTSGHPIIHRVPDTRRG